MIELKFTCEILIGLSSISELGDIIWCVGEHAEGPSVAALCPESEEDEIMLVRIRRRGSGCQYDAKHKATAERCERNEDD